MNRVIYLGVFLFCCLGSAFFVVYFFHFGKHLIDLVWATTYLGVGLGFLKLCAKE